MKSPGSYVPLLNWAIETGVDINLIERIMDTYSRVYPGALKGLWYPMHCERLIFDGVRITRDFPSPMLVAAKSGRLDVIKALIAYGVEIRERNAIEHVGQYDMKDTLKEVVDHTRVEAEIDAFSLACEADEEIAEFMIRNGLDLRCRDLWWPVEFGRMQILETLLRRPLFKTNEGHEAIKAVLRCIVSDCNSYPIRDFGVINPLLDAMTNPSFPPFDKIGWLEKSTAMVLSNSGGRYADALGFYLFDLFKTSGVQSIINFKIAVRAAGSDNFLEITKAMLLEVEHSKKAEESKELPMIDYILRRVSAGFCTRTAMCFLNFGYKFSSIRLQEAVISTKFTAPCDSRTYTDQLDLIDILVNSGISVNLIIDPRIVSWHKDETLLELALDISELRWTRDSRKGLDCRVALRLLHHGADPTKVRNKTIQRWLTKVYQDQSLTDYFLDEMSHQNDSTDIGREIFSQKIPSVDSPLYFDQVYNMAVMVLGKVPLEICFRDVVKKEERKKRIWTGRVNGFRGSPMAPPEWLKTSSPTY
ncbi:hypothetical protein F4815DRAFT_497617 [Daldinia loculata]|nr:hypothetical protein F4815DRAFT_497617 [Daldinia loculata]